MGWFGRKPRKVGFGVSEAKPVPPKPSKYSYPKPASAQRSRAWGNAQTPTYPNAQLSGTEILHQRDAAPTIEETPEKAGPDEMTLQQLEALKKRSPWLGTVAEKMVSLQTRGRVGKAMTPLATPKTPKKSKLGLIIIALIIFFFLLGPILTGIVASLGI